GRGLNAVGRCRSGHLPSVSALERRLPCETEFWSNSLRLPWLRRSQSALRHSPPKPLQRAPKPAKPCEPRLPKPGKSDATPTPRTRRHKRRKKPAQKPQKNL